MTPSRVASPVLRRRRWRRVLIAGGAVLAVAFAACLLAGEALVRPANGSVGEPPADLAVRVVTFPSVTGRDVHGWLVAGNRAGAGVLLVHGLRSDRRSMVPRARFLHRLGYTVLLIDLQAHGESPGEHMTFGYLEAQDVQAAAGYLRDAVHGGPIAAIGVSLGGAAILLARPAIAFRVVVLESVYSTFDEALDNRMRQYFGPLGPPLANVLACQTPIRLGISPSDLRPIDRIRQLREPLLLVQGDEDRSATLAQAERLFSAAPGPGKHLWVVRGAGHQDLYRFAPQEYQTRVTALLSQSLRVTAPFPEAGRSGSVPVSPSGGGATPWFPTPRPATQGPRRYPGPGVVPDG